MFKSITSQELFFNNRCTNGQYINNLCVDLYKAKNNTIVTKTKKTINVNIYKLSKMHITITFIQNVYTFILL